VHSHQVARSDIDPLFQKGSSDDTQSPVKFLRRGQSACDAELIAYKPFSPKCEQTDGDPNRVETRCGVGLQGKRIDHEQEYTRKNVYALI
jgi:hypothetical protein